MSTAVRLWSAVHLSLQCGHVRVRDFLAAALLLHASGRRLRSYTQVAVACVTYLRCVEGAAEHDPAVAVRTVRAGNGVPLRPLADGGTRGHCGLHLRHRAVRDDPAGSRILPPRQMNSTRRVASAA